MEEKQTLLTGKMQWKVFKRLLTYLKPHKKKIAIALFLLVITVTVDILGPYLISVFMDDYLTPKYFPTGPLVGLALGYVFIQITNAIVSYFQLLKFQEIALKIIQQMGLMFSPRFISLV